jgi:hypothetical protein
MAKRSEELEIFVEHLMDFMNLWTVYNDHLTGKYVPSVDVGGKPSRTGMYVTLMFHLYASFYALVDDSKEGLNAFRIWREHFSGEEAAIAAVKQQIAPFKSDLRLFRNCLGYHGSRTRSHEARGWDLFANASGSAIWNAMVNFKGLGATLLAKERAERKSDAEKVAWCRARIDSMADHARQQTAA